MCNNIHRVITVTNTGTTIELGLTDSVNIGNMETFNVICCKPVSALVTGAPIPITAVINGSVAPVKDIYGQPLLSNVVPLGLTRGKYIVDSEGNPYVWLKTPRYA